MGRQVQRQERAYLDATSRPAAERIETAVDDQRDIGHCGEAPAAVTGRMTDGPCVHQVTGHATAAAALAYRRGNGTKRRGPAAVNAATTAWRRRSPAPWRWRCARNADLRAGSVANR